MNANHLDGLLDNLEDLKKIPKKSVDKNRFYYYFLQVLCLISPQMCALLLYVAFFRQKNFSYAN